MTRDISAAIKTASQDRVMSPFLLGEFQIDSGTVFVSSLDHDIAWGDMDLFDPGAGGFEGAIGVDNWVPVGTNTIEVSTDIAHGGTKSAKITYVNSFQGAYLQFRDSLDLISDLQVGKKYRVRGWAAVNTGSVDIIIWDSTAIVATVTINSTTMVPFSLDFFPLNATTSNIQMANMGAGEIIYLDDLTIEEVWLGVGQIGAVSAVEESMALQATGLRMALTGIPSDYVTMVLSEDYQGRPAIMRLGFMDTDLGTIIVDPVIIFQGFLDQMKLTDGDTATIQITCENELIAWQRPNVARYTNADQQALYPGDLGLEFVSQAVEKEIVWGSGPAPVTMYNAYGRSAWIQNYDPFGQPIFPGWWNDPPAPPPSGDFAVGGGGGT